MSTLKNCLTLGASRDKNKNQNLKNVRVYDNYVLSALYALLFHDDLNNFITSPTI